METISYDAFYQVNFNSSIACNKYDPYLSYEQCTLHNNKFTGRKEIIMPTFTGTRACTNILDVESLQWRKAKPDRRIALQGGLIHKYEFISLNCVPFSNIKLFVYMSLGWKKQMKFTTLVELTRRESPRMQYTNM